MRVVLLRHATRDMQMAEDGPLSKFGFEQAELLTTQLKPEGALPVPTILLASPKKRARQTLHPIAHLLSLPVVVTSALDERRNDESGSAFKTRILTWTEMMARELAQDDVVWACTHMDWLEEAMLLLPSDLTEIESASGFSPAESQSFEIVDGIWQSRTRLHL